MLGPWPPRSPTPALPRLRGREQPAAVASVDFPPPPAGEG
jgi:hypothetical protein